VGTGVDQLRPPSVDRATYAPGFDSPPLKNVANTTPSAAATLVAFRGQPSISQRWAVMRWRGEKVRPPSEETMRTLSRNLPSTWREPTYSRPSAAANAVN